MKNRRGRAMFCLMLSATVACASFTADRSVWAKERSKYWWDFIVNETFVLFDATHDLGAAIVDGVIPHFNGRQRSPAAITGIWSNLVRLGANPLCVHTSNLNRSKTKPVRNPLKGWSSLIRFNSLIRFRFCSVNAPPGAKPASHRIKTAIVNRV